MTDDELRRELVRFTLKPTPPRESPNLAAGIIHRALSAHRYGEDWNRMVLAIIQGLAEAIATLTRRLVIAESKRPIQIHFPAGTEPPSDLGVAEQGTTADRRDHE